MTTIEVMLEALKWASATVIPLDCPTIKERITEAIAAGEAELRREPVAWMHEWCYDGEDVGYHLYQTKEQCQAAVDNEGGVCTPLYTRGEIK